MIRQSGALRARHPTRPQRAGLAALPSGRLRSLRTSIANRPAKAIYASWPRECKENLALVRRAASGGKRTAPAAQLVAEFPLEDRDLPLRQVHVFLCRGAVVDGKRGIGAAHVLLHGGVGHGQVAAR